MPTSQSDFPDVDGVFAEAAGPPPVLEYCHAKPAVRIPQRSVAANEVEAWANVGRFVRRLVFAGAWAALFGGLGLSLNARGDGGILMALGAGILGLFFPIPGTRRDR